MTKRNLFGKSSQGPKLPPMHLVCSTDELMQNMQCVHIQKGIATATDANCLVRFNLNGYLSEESLQAMEGKLIHKGLWKLMCSVNSFWVRADDKGVYITLGRNAVVHGKYEDEKYPNYAAILNDLLEAKHLEAKQSISMNVRILNKIATVLGTAGVCSQYNFTFNTNNKAIIVSHNNHDDGIAILMPVMNDKTQSSWSKFVAEPLTK
jgi:hypothetical protein